MLSQRGKDDVMKIQARNLLVLALLLVATSAFAKEKTEPYSDSAKLEGAKRAELQIDLGLAELDMKAGESKTLIDISGRYVPKRSRPRLEVDREGDVAYIMFTNDLRTNSDTNNRKSKDNEYYDVRISDKPIYSMNLDVGLGSCTMNLDKLTVERFVFNAGLADAYLQMETPNTVRANRVELETGLGELQAIGMGNLRFELLKIESGLGDVELDLRGYEGRGEVEMSIGLGSCKMILPKEIGARIYYDDNFLSSSDFDGFEEVRNGVYETENYDTAESLLDIDASVGMGHLTITRRD